MKRAVLAVHEGEKCATVARLMGIPRGTLQKKVKTFENDHDAKLFVKRGRKTVF